MAKRKHKEKIFLTLSTLSTKKVKTKKFKRVSHNKDGSVTISGVNRNGYKFYTKNIVVTTEKKIKKIVQEFENKKVTKNTLATVKAQFYKGRINHTTGKISGKAGNVLANIVETRKGRKIKKLKSRKRKNISSYSEQILLQLNEFAIEYKIDYESEFEERI